MPGLYRYTFNKMARRKRRKRRKTAIIQTGGKKGITLVLGRLYIDGKPYKKFHFGHSGKNISNNNGAKVPGARNNIKLWS